MIKKKRFSSSVRKFIRGEKARIRRQVLDLKEQERQIQTLVDRFVRKEERATASSLTT